MTENNTQQSMFFWVGIFAASCASIASLVLSGPKLGLWTSMPGCGPESGCDVVTNGPLGNIPLGFMVWPVSFVGTAWFIAISGLWKNTKGNSKPLLWLIRLGVLGSLGFILAMIIGGHFCKWCALVHFCNLALWICAELQVRASKNICDRCLGKGFLFGFVLVSVILGVVYMFASTKKKADDKRAGIQNAAEIIRGEVDNTTLKLLESDHRFGSQNAPIQVVMFTDYQCPDCKRLETQLTRIYEQRNDLSIVVKHFPLNYDCNDEIGKMKLHGNACWAARAAETAFLLGGQDGWERMHTWLFANGGSFTDATFASDLTMLGFESQLFLQTMQSSATLQNVKRDAVDGKALGIWFTPMIFINGVEYLWYYGGQDSLARVINSVGNAVASGKSSVVAPPSAVEKLVADWRVGKVHSFQEHDRLSWSGDGDVEIIVWGDYQTEPTIKLDSLLRDVLSEGVNAKYAYRHFPIDSNCNPGVKNYKNQYPGSCEMAKVVEAVDILCGNEARWRVHKLFMTTQRSVSLNSLTNAAASVCSQSAETIADVAASVDVGIRLRDDINSKLRVWKRSVPVLVIDGRFIPRWEIEGTTGRDTLLQIIDEASK